MSRRETSRKQPRVSEAMFEAIVAGNRPAIESLIAGGESLSATYKSTGLTTLLLSTGVASVEILDLLIRSGADVHARDLLGNTALSRAAKANRPESVALFLRHGLGVDDPNEHGSTALHNAVFDNAFEAVALLLKHGADPDRANNGGITPRMIVKGDPKSRLRSLFDLS